MKKTKRILCIITLLLIISTALSLNIHASYNGFIGHCPGYFYEYTISGYVISAADYSLSGDIAIPSEINGIPVEAISSFSACENIKSITIPASVKYIGDRAFYNCKNLEKIIIHGEIIHMGTEALHGTKWYDSQPDGIVYLDDILYSYKGELSENEDITINDSTRLIANSAFHSKGDIGRITIPSGVELIGNYAFYGCNADEVVFENGLRRIGNHAFALNNLSEVSIPDTVTEICENAFLSNPIRSIKLSDNITELPRLFGTNCPDTLHIPKNVEKINFDMFANVSVSNLTVHKENKFFSTDGYGLYNKDATVLYLYLDKQPSSPIFADTTEVISKRCFYNYTSIKNLVFPDSLKTIEDYAFYNCNNLESITFNDGLETIGNFAFTSCSSVSEINIPDSVTTIKSGAFSACANLSFVKLPENLTVLDTDFTGCKNLKTIHIPKNVQTISEFVFRNNIYIESITVDENNEYFTSDKNGVLFNKDKTTLIRYPQAKQEESYIIPETVTLVGKSAFEANTYLKKVIFPQSLEKIDSYAFYGCSDLFDISLPDKAIIVNNFAFTNTKMYKEHPNGVIYIGKIAYGHKGSIQEKCIVLREDTLSIAQYAFSSLNFTDIMIYDSLLNVAPDAFYKSKLTNVHYSGTKEQWNKIIIAPDGNTALTNATKHYSTVKHVFTSADISGATFGKNGTIIKHCACGYSEKGVYYGVSENVFDQTDFIYNGKYQCPIVSIKNLKGEKLSHINHSYEIASQKEIGKYKVTIRLMNYYEGEKDFYFTIRPDKAETVKATQTDSSVTIKWSKVKKATGYRVYQYNYSTKKWKTVLTTTDRSCTIKNLKPGTKYKFSVKAYTKTADGTIWSNNTTHIETATKPATPTLKLSSSKKGTANISWSNVNGESGYQVYYSTKKNGDYKKVNTYKANVTTGSKTKLSSGKTYYFKVRAYKKTAAGTVYSSFSSVKSIKIK